jgi:hypothetical protein
MQIEAMERKKTGGRGVNPINPRAIRLVSHHRHLGALGIGLFARRRKDLGNELDHEISTRLVRRDSEPRRQFFTRSKHQLRTINAKEINRINN